MLLLDEPFGALDARVRQDLRRWLDELHRELGVTSLLVTHDQEEALELANQIVVMHQGKVEQVGSPDEIYDEPATAFVAGFVGAANVLHGQVVDGHVHFGVDPRARRRPPRGGLARPRRSSVRTTCGSRPGAPNGSIYATIERVASLGWLARLSLRFPDGTVIVAHVPQDELAGAGEGDTISVDLRNPKAFQREESAERCRADARRRCRARHERRAGPRAAVDCRGSGDVPAEVAPFAALPEEQRKLLMHVSELLGEIAYGNVMIVLQDGKVIQIETSEKIRLR